MKSCANKLTGSRFVHRSYVKILSPAWVSRLPYPSSYRGTVVSRGQIMVALLKQDLVITAYFVGATEERNARNHIASMIVERRRERCSIQQNH